MEFVISKEKKGSACVYVWSVCTCTRTGDMWNGKKHKKRTFNILFLKNFALVKHT